MCEKRCIWERSGGIYHIYYDAKGEIDVDDSDSFSLAVSVFSSRAMNFQRTRECIIFHLLCAYERKEGFVWNKSFRASNYNFNFPFKDSSVSQTQAHASLIDVIDMASALSYVSLILFVVVFIRQRALYFLSCPGGQTQSVESVDSNVELASATNGEVKDSSSIVDPVIVSSSTSDDPAPTDDEAVVLPDPRDADSPMEYRRLDLSPLLKRDCALIALHHDSYAESERGIHQYRSVVELSREHSCVAVILSAAPAIRGTEERPCDFYDRTVVRPEREGVEDVSSKSQRKPLPLILCAEVPNLGREQSRFAGFLADYWEFITTTLKKDFRMYFAALPITKHPSRRRFLQCSMKIGTPRWDEEVKEMGAEVGLKVENDQRNRAETPFDSIAIVQHDFANRDICSDGHNGNTVVPLSVPLPIVHQSSNDACTTN